MSNYGVKALKVYTHSLLGNTFINEVSLLPGSIEFLLKLKEKYILALATRVNPENLKKMFKKFSVPKVFSEIIFSSELTDSTKAKPNGFMVEQILKRTSTHAKDTILVGDAANDILMGRNAGVLPVAVLTGHLTREEAEQLGVQYIIDDVTKLESVLETVDGPKKNLEISFKK